MRIVNWGSDVCSAVLFSARILGVPPEWTLLAYHDATAGHQRLACFNGRRLVGALFLAPEPVAVSRSWAVDLLGAETTIRSARLAVMAGRPSRGLVDRG